MTVHGVVLRLAAACCIALSAVAQRPQTSGPYDPICASPDGPVRHIDGNVTAGKPFVRALGRGLVLRVTTDGIGVFVAGETKRSDSLAACVTPPWHGPNALAIEAWHFEPAHRDSGPGTVRVFQFVTSGPDRGAACAALEESPGSDATAAAAPAALRSTLGLGRLVLSRVKLGPPVNSDGLGREVSSFHVAGEITLPRHTPLR